LLFTATQAARVLAIGRRKLEHSGPASPDHS
jgi:hypothetical protein